VRADVEPVTSGYSDGRVAAELAAGAVSIADATCSPSRVALIILLVIACGFTIEGALTAGKLERERNHG